ncbi:MtrB/PioB family decaheme-associated outer membrane protein [Shewanella mesophila]|uniref:MtrB/PioB family decaheme-associated outer membrane protein n=1 Tax=Shewanella mesophila TaxID=2864208 RepID=UPI001C661D95|nr:MtrB/PioB family decaheme-associated outer membrane protein [Shewanella mesophila]QYJ87392.1 MtrB/PioB family decaheme-associated outer membrane protein [Shewanella mesophila]
MNNHNRHNRLPLRLSTLAFAIISTMAYSEGYGISSANRDSLKLDGWKCQRCAVTTGTHGQIGIGAAHNDGEDSRFGNTTGTDKDGVVASLEANVTHQNETGYRTRFKADKLGYENGSAALTTGKPGQYAITAAYRGITHYDTNQALTPYTTQNGRWQLPQQWQAGATTAQMSELNASSVATELKIARDRYRLNGAYRGDFYKAEIDYQHEQRQGQRTASANLLTNSTMLAQRIDDSTDELNAKLYLSGDNWLAGIDAGLSHYSNDEQSLHWQSAFTPTFGAAYFGQSSVAPDNKAYRIAGSTQFSDAGQQVLMHIGFTRMTQDQAYLPATINGPSPMLPSANLDGQVDIIEMKLNYSGRITRELSLRASYDYRDRDNKTEINSYPQIVTDSYYAGNAANPEYDRTKQQVNIAAKYRIAPAAYIDVGYEYDHNNYSDLDRQSLQELTLFGKFNYRVSSQWQLWLKAQASDRSGSSYQAVNTTSSPSNPLLRKSYLADRERQRYALYTSYSGDSYNISANAHWMQDDYTDTLIGLTNVETQGYDLSAQYTINDNLNLNAFLNQDWRDSDQAGSSNYATPNWYSSSEEQSTLIGAGINYANLMDKKLNLGLDYTYADGQSDTQVVQGLRSPYGSDFSTKHNINAFADYRVSERVGLRFDWIYEQYQDADWANQGLTLDTLPNVLSFGDLSHDYGAHYFGLTLSYQL